MKIIIDNQGIDVRGQKTILEVARENNIYIPSLCDHPHLVPFSGCRLCIVEVKGRKGFVPSCSTYVSEGMEVLTRNPRLHRNRKLILELILSEHPNACLICSEKEQCDEYKSTIRKVGEVTGCVLCPNNSRCQLQEVVEALEIKRVSFPSLYRNFEIRKDDPFFDRNYNLCILCGRCVRVCKEVRGASAVSFVFRGSQAVVGTFLDRTLIDSGCQFCGACVDACPTGALTERAARPEILPEKTAQTVCPLCSIGCTLKIDIVKNRILSSAPLEDGAVNRGQACVKGRFVIRDVVHSSQRILKPLIRVNGKLEEAAWDKAFNFISQRLKKYNGKEIAFISSSQSTNEENFLFQRFAQKVLKTGSIDSPARFSTIQSFVEWSHENHVSTGLNFKIEEISLAKTIFLIGTNLTVSHPVIGLEVIKAVNNGARLIIVDPQDVCLSRYSSHYLRINPGTDLYLLLSLSKILLDEGELEGISSVEGSEPLRKSLDKFDVSRSSEITGIPEEKIKEVSEALLMEGPVNYLFGLGLTQHPWGKKNISALWNLALQTDGKLFPLSPENNLRGELEIRSHFQAGGLPYNQIIQSVKEGRIKVLYSAGPFPLFENSKPEFLIIQDSYMNEGLELADAVLPATLSAETEGTFTNAEGRIQKLDKVIEPPAEAKPDWWIISRLAEKMGHKDFNYKNPSQIMNEMKKEIQSFADVSYSLLKKKKEVFIHEKKEEARKFVPLEYEISSYLRSREFPFLMIIDYSLDYYRNLRLAGEIRGLRMIRDSRWIRINPEDAEKLRLKDREEIEIESASRKIGRIVRIRDSVPRGIIQADFIWNEDSEFSVARLCTESNPDSFSWKVIPVKINRKK